MVVGFVALSIGVANAADDLIVAVDKATLVKVIGVSILAFQAEIWRNQRVLFRSNEKLGKELRALQGYCRGKNGDCADDNEGDE